MVGKSNRVCIRLLREDGSEAGFLDPGSLGKNSRLAEFFADIFKGNNIILNSDDAFAHMRRPPPPSPVQLVSVAAQCIETLPPDSKFLQQLIYAATMHARTSIAQPKQGKLQKKVVEALNGYWESAADALNGVKNFITCDDIMVPMERMLSMQQRSADQFQGLGSRVTALEIEAVKFKDALARVEKMAFLSVAGTQACEAPLSRFIDENETRTQANEAQLDAGVASSKAQAKALAALHEQNVAGVARCVELERSISKLRARHEELEAREEVFEREQALRVSELDTALEQQKLLTAVLSKKLAEITSLKLRDAKRQMEIFSVSQRKLLAAAIR
ncbi:hypothetical protein EMIHUDRAFT_237066 [Emiliania huxleyi CCMP1516]|uniref:Uncharacterized protein n=2 Tax=Emiliania huxleyi TaxID=2903 RepID=A0A0D3JRL3_EMIH1|nr:hypothetical protein EMIHUDRAFT_237066 [Emiliania huxleyi CCMP1516]EOD26148.1 hypothetical protein EMIHUDRAFT_237066 [Emiliania huxleyi CCMP1516]|eukprot:XP_005778577.1 hypothetical protein EMIHUDRAFT_237066 [Emiliania huxleyi CCMP1516]